MTAELDERLGQRSRLQPRPSAKRDRVSRECNLAAAHAQREYCFSKLGSRNLRRLGALACRTGDG